MKKERIISVASYTVGTAWLLVCIIGGTYILQNCSEGYEFWLGMFLPIIFIVWFFIFFWVRKFLGLCLRLAFRIPKEKIA